MRQSNPTLKKTLGGFTDRNPIKKSFDTRNTFKDPIIPRDFSKDHPPKIPNPSYKYFGEGQIPNKSPIRKMPFIEDLTSLISDSEDTQT